MKNGIEPELISKLDDLGIKPSDFEKFDIVSREVAETAAKAILRTISSAKAEEH
ncbi:MAG: hypothetical protein ACOYIF_03615 [Acetivibrionales bacterium]|jgi:nicotinamide mononucleotide (NMN) deamidase PncC